MKKNSFLALFSFVMLIPAIVTAGTYYVTQNGSGSQNGLNFSNAWSVNDFNSSGNWSTVNDSGKISPGDTVFFSGTITSTVKPGGSGSASGGFITLDGFENGETNHMAGADANGALITVSDGYGIQLSGNKYIKIQDFRVNNCSTAIVSSATNSNETLYNISIRRISMDGNSNGVYLTSSPSSISAGSYITIEDCEIVDTAIGDTSSAKAGLRVANLQDLIIRRNHIYQRPNVELVADGQDGIMSWHNHRVLIEYNRIHHVSEDGLDVKNDVGNDHGDYIVRFNIMYDARQTGITLQHEEGHNAYVYGNNIHGWMGWYPILVQRGFENAFVWSNILYNGSKAGIAVYDQDSERPVDKVHVFNNTILDMGTESTSKYHAGIRFDNAITSLTIKNNILVGNNLNSGYNTQISSTYSAASRTTSDYNLFWIAESIDPRIYQETTLHTLSHPVSETTYYSFTGQEENSSVGNPYFVDREGYDLRLTKDSILAIGTGQNLSTPPEGWAPPTIQGVDYSSQLSLAIGLDPYNTDWDQTPPIVNTTNRNDLGSWDKGAYVYYSGIQSALYAPSGVTVEGQ